VIYVASADRAEFADVWRMLMGSRIADALGPARLGSASTLLGVSKLGYPGQLVEIDVTAVLPG
jgi:hypothetical protein